MFIPDLKESSVIKQYLVKAEFLKNMFLYNKTIPFIKKIRIIAIEIAVRLGWQVGPHIFLSPSHQCNLKCDHCFEVFNNKRDRYNMDTAELKKVIDDFYELRGTRITFCSGEFLMRSDAIELVEYASKKGFFVAVTSNGLLLTEKKLIELQKAGLSNLTISIDSPNAKEHDSNRNKSGLHDHIVKVLPLIKKHHINFRVWSFISKSNFNHLEEFNDFAEKHNISEIFFFFTLLSGHFFNRPEENLTREERDWCREKTKKLKRIRLEFYKEDDLCAGGGKEHYNIMPTGDVTFCPPIPYSYGNVRKEPMAQIFDRVRKDRKKFRHLKGECPVNFQEYRDECNAELLEYAVPKTDNKSAKQEAPFIV